MKYMICYDLHQPIQNYTTLYKVLRDDFGATRVLQSQWVFRRINTDAVGLRDYFTKFLDRDDRLLIVSLESSDWAGWNLIAKISKL